MWTSDEINFTTSIAWGDINKDGFLDLVTGNDGQPNQIYMNSFGSLSSTPNWSSIQIDNTKSIALADFDGDGDLHSATGNSNYPVGQPVRIYQNENGSLTTNPVWSSPYLQTTTSVSWGDFDGDSNIDLAVGNTFYPDRVYKVYARVFKIDSPVGFHQIMLLLLLLGGI